MRSSPCHCGCKAVLGSFGKVGRADLSWIEISGDDWIRVTTEQLYLQHLLPEWRTR